MTDEKEEFCWKVFYKDFFAGSITILGIIIIFGGMFLMGLWVTPENPKTTTWCGADKICQWQDYLVNGSFVSLGLAALLFVVGGTTFVLCCALHERYWIKKKECEEK